VTLKLRERVRKNGREELKRGSYGNSERLFISGGRVSFC
jgi:hypothetical protein